MLTTIDTGDGVYNSSILISSNTELYNNALAEGRMYGLNSVILSNNSTSESGESSKLSAN